MVVLFVADDAERAIVRVDADPVRLLGKSGGSTERVAGAIKTRQAPPQDDSIRWGTEFEPERLSVEDEAEVVRAAHDRRNQGIREKIARAEEAISGLLDDGAAASDIRFHRGLLAKLEGKLTREEATDRAAA